MNATPEIVLSMRVVDRVLGSNCASLCANRNVWQYHNGRSATRLALSVITHRKILRNSSCSGPPRSAVYSMRLLASVGAQCGAKQSRRSIATAQWRMLPLPACCQRPVW